jgi:hypothetical protein
MAGVRSNWLSGFIPWGTAMECYPPARVKLILTWVSTSTG